MLFVNETFVLIFSFFYRPQRSCGQGYVFIRVCNSVHRGGCLPQCMLGYHPPGNRHPPGSRPPRADTPQSRHTHPWNRPPKSRHTPGADTPSPAPEQTHLQEQTHPQEQTPPRSRHPLGADTSPPESRLQHTVNERPVRILLECILVLYGTQVCF